MGAELVFPSSETLPEALTAAAEHGLGEYVLHLAEGSVQLSSAELAERAGRGARTLARRGVEPGDRVGILGPNRVEWIVWAFSTWTAGATLVPLQLPLRLRDADALREQLRAVLEACCCKLVVTAPELAGLVPETPAMIWSDLPTGAGYETRVEPDDLAVVQFTSGSTREPKGAMLTHGAVLAQMRALYDVILDWRPKEDRWLMWAPFFHDLGLFISVVAPAAFGGAAHLLPTERFARTPTQWLALVEETRATWTVAPCSAWAAAVSGVLRQHLPIDLSSLRFAGFGGETINPDEVSRLLRESTRLKLDPASLAATYGLAEAVLSATVTRSGDGIHFDRVDSLELAASGRAVPASTGRRLVSSGRPALGMEVRIAHVGEELPNRHVGEIQLRGKSIMQGYLGSSDDDPFADAWLRTGDLGYLADGELYVTGRSKDVMIVMGHNYYPDDFEWAAGRVEGVRAGRCVAFVTEASAKDSVMLLVEPARACDPEVLSRSVRHAVFDAVGVQPQTVFVVPRGAIQMTTSGKLRRGATREAFLRGELKPIVANTPAV